MAKGKGTRDAISITNMRIIVLGFAICTAIYGSVSLMILFADQNPSQRFLSDEIRLATGGFVPSTKFITAGLGILGLLFGVVGVLGCYDYNSGQVRLFGGFLQLRIVVCAFIFSVDFLDLNRCEVWVGSADANLHYNADMEHLNIENECSWTRTIYTIGWIIDFMSNAIGCFIASRFCVRMDENVLYLIKTEAKSQPPSVFVSRCNDYDYGSISQPSPPEDVPRIKIDEGV